MSFCVWIKQVVIDFISNEGNKHYPNETGGVLIGYQALSGDFVITQIVGPGENAIHGRTYFKPDNAYHMKEIARIYKESNQMETYLGDWHTHPDSYPYLSGSDRSTLKKISNYRKARLKTPLMLVAAPPDNSIGVWIGQSSKWEKVLNPTQATIATYA